MSAATIPHDELIIDATEQIHKDADCTLRVVDDDSYVGKGDPLVIRGVVHLPGPFVTDFRINRSKVAGISPVLKTLLTSDRWEDTGKEVIVIREVDTDSMRPILYAASRDCFEGKSNSVAKALNFPFERFNVLLATLDQFCIPPTLLSIWAKKYRHTCPELKLKGSFGARVAVRFHLSTPEFWNEYTKHLILYVDGPLAIDTPQGIQDEDILNRIAARIAQIRAHLRSRLRKQIERRQQIFEHDPARYLPPPPVGQHIRPIQDVFSVHLATVGQSVSIQPLDNTGLRRIRVFHSTFGADGTDATIISEDIADVLPQALRSTIREFDITLLRDPDCTPYRLGRIVNSVCARKCGLFADCLGPPFDVCRVSEFETLCVDCLKRSFKWGDDEKAAVWSEWKKNEEDWSVGCEVQHGESAFLDSFLGSKSVLDKLVQSKKNHGSANSEAAALREEDFWDFDGSEN